MTIANDFNQSGIVQRARNILLKPAETWSVIAEEPATAAGLFTGYAASFCVEKRAGPPFRAARPRLPQS